jgi:hypothetical protein
MEPLADCLKQVGHERSTVLSRLIRNVKGAFPPGLPSPCLASIDG